MTDRTRADEVEALPEKPMLVAGTRVRHHEHPELTGVIKHYEWNAPGVLSPVPYCIGWDESARAADLLGWFFVYASDRSVERVEETP